MTGERLALEPLSLAGKLGLAVVSGCSYLWVGRIASWAERSELVTFDELFSPLHLIAAIFGLLVLAPQVVARRMLPLRVLALCILSILIYQLAIRFVVSGPFDYRDVTPFLVSGGVAAALAGLAVAVLAPRRPLWPAAAGVPIAGALGGGLFIWLPPWWPEFELQAGHLAWQVLVCLSLHFALPAPGGPGLNAGRRQPRPADDQQ